MRIRTFKLVSNHHGWSLWGIRTWLRGGWCNYCRWGKEPSINGRVPVAQTCRKVGMIAWCMDDHRRHAAWMAERPWLGKSF